MAGVSLVSPVSFLKAKPRMAIFFPLTVLNRLEITMSTNLRFCRLLIVTTDSQYLAISSRPRPLQMYTMFRMSFWKQDPPKPTLAFRNLGPILESAPMHLAISDTSAPVFSQRAEMELMEEILWARKAFAASLASSEDHRLLVRICSSGTHWAYTSLRVWIAFRPLGVCLPPMMTLSGFSRSLMAVPSARNSGFDRMSKRAPSLRTLLLSTLSTACAVLTGTVDFSTMIFGECDTLAIILAAPSQYVMSAA
mmetsp:Transcript_8269/g.28399  ORF Transcript_8269/g.28399 Transcript_8269/m.28399 type:complete len:251 (+) Transcript_8269:821-1573(+)